MKGQRLFLQSSGLERKHMLYFYRGFYDNIRSSDISKLYLYDDSYFHD